MFIMSWIITKSLGWSLVFISIGIMIKLKEQS